MNAEVAAHHSSICAFRDQHDPMAHVECIHSSSNVHAGETHACLAISQILEFEFLWSQCSGHAQGCQQLLVSACQTFRVNAGQSTDHAMRGTHLLQKLQCGHLDKRKCAHVLLHLHAQSAVVHAICRLPDGSTMDVTPAQEAGFNVRTRVHEYGGACLIFASDAVFFSNFK